MIWSRRQRCTTLLLAVMSVVEGVQAGVAVTSGGVGPVSPPPSTSTGTSTASSATTSASVVPTVVYQLLSEYTTCETQLINWQYTGNSQEFRVTVSNSNFASPSSSSSSSGVIGNVPPQRRLVVSEVLFTQPANFEGYNWTVNVPAGEYILDGLLASGQTPTSQVFTVVDGTDVSCVGAPLSSSTTSAGSTLTTSHTSTSTSGPASKTSTSAATSGTSILSSSQDTSKSSHTGAIVGGVVAALVIIAVAIGAAYYLCRVAPSRKRAQLGGSEKKHWGGLPSGDFTARRPGQVQTAPVAALGGAGARAGSGLGPTPGSSDDDVAGYGLAKEIRSAPGDLGTTVMPLAYDSRSSFTPSMIAPSPFRTKVPSSRVPSSRTSMDSTRGMSMSSNPNRMSRSRSGGANVGVQSMPERAAQRSSLDMGRFGTESIPMARTASVARRTQRKPVPQYDATEFSSSSPSNTTLPSEFGAQNPFETQPSSPAETSNSHASPLSAAGHNHNNMPRKSSFPDMDNRPVHYLIPDMPPPAQQ